MHARPLGREKDDECVGQQEVRLVNYTWIKNKFKQWLEKQMLGYTVENSNPQISMTYTWQSLFLNHAKYPHYS